MHFLFVEGVEKCPTSVYSLNVDFHFREFIYRYKFFFIILASVIFKLKHELYLKFKEKC